MKKLLSVIFLTFVLLAILLSGCVLAPTHPISIQITYTPTHIATQTETPVQPTSTTRGKTIIVTSIDDSGDGTLRQALSDAEVGDIIIFDPIIFPPDNPVSIILNNGLPPIHQGYITVDASDTGVILDGSQAGGEWTPGIELASSHNVIYGLQVINFTGPGILINPEARFNTIGGDRSIGSGLLGQGNLFSNTSDGVAIMGSDNHIVGNLIGTDVIGSGDMGNRSPGVFLEEDASRNIIGPDNIIAYNGVDGGGGVEIRSADAQGNVITGNSIHDNSAVGIYYNIGDGLSLELPIIPVILGFDIETGFVEGVACSQCVVEIFSTSSKDGEIFEGQVVADDNGNFSLNKDNGFSGPWLTATSQAPDENTSPFSEPTTGERQDVDLQADNTNPKSLIETRPVSMLANNQIGPMISLGGSIDSEQAARDYLRFTNQIGFTSTRLSLDCFDWSEIVEGQCGYSSADINPIHDQLITDLATRGITIVYGLVFWDSEIEDPGTTGYSRFKTQDEIDRYLDYAQYIAKHFKGRIQYYEILNETFFGEDSDFTQQNIALDDYINLVHQVIPVIKAADPDAKIVAGPAPAVYDQDCYEYQLGILSSDLIMPEVDAVSWHPGPYPVELSGDVDHLYRVPETIQEMQSTAEAHGFTGDYIPEEIQWPTSYNPSPSQPWNVFNEIVSAKYFGRGILDHRGLGLPALLAGTASEGNLPKMDVIRNLANLLSGAEPTPLPLETQSELTNVVSYTFTYEGENKYLIALWEDGFATDKIEPGTPLTLTLPNFTTTLQISNIGDLSIIGYDVLHNYQQSLDAHLDGDSLVIPDLQVRDYPLILLLSQK